MLNIFGNQTSKKIAKPLNWAWKKQCKSWACCVPTAKRKVEFSLMIILWRSIDTALGVPCTLLMPIIITKMTVHGILFLFIVVNACRRVHFHSTPRLLSVLSVADQWTWSTPLGTTKRILYFIHCTPCTLSCKCISHIKRLLNMHKVSNRAICTYFKYGPICLMFIFLIKCKLSLQKWVKCKTVDEIKRNLL